MEQAAQAVLGRPPDQAEWLSYKFDEVGQSPVLLFAYPRALPRGVPYIAREVKIEFGSLTDQRPIGCHPIKAFVDEIAAGAFTDLGAEVVALELERTFWEKATILHADFHRPTDRPMRDRHARHYADFAALWKHEPAKAARSRLDLLERVRVHKARFFSSSWAHYNTAVPGTLRLVPPTHRIDGLRTDYEAMRQMFLNDPLPFEEVLATLDEAERTLNRHGDKNFC